MDPSEVPLGRSRGRGRSLYQHPPIHGDPTGLSRSPWSLTEGGPRPPVHTHGRQLLGFKAPLTIGVSTTGTSSEDTANSPIGRGRGHPVKLAKSSGSPSTSLPSAHLTKLGTGSGSDQSKQIIYPDARPTAADIDRKRREEREAYIRTRPKEIDSKIGTDGQKITCEANYFRFRKAPTWNIYLHRIDFQPEILLDKTRRELIRGINEMFDGGYLFDGTQLFLTKKLEDPMGPIERTVVSADGKMVNIMIRFVGVVSMQEERAVQIMNLILRRAMDGLHLQTVGRNKYDATAKELVRSLRVEVWPGYITSIRQHEQDILMCAEISHKIMRSETVYDIIVRIRNESRDDFRKALEKTLLGTTVLTDYNNKTYRIDDIRYDICPTDTFPTKDGEISYVNYYKKYDKTIKDLKQPLLVSNLKEKDIRGGQADKIILVPELCRATGLTEDMRTNFRTMKELSTFTRVGPASRMERLRTFNERLRTSPESIAILKRWNLELDPELIKIPARILPLPKLLFGGERSVELGTRVDWTAEFRTRSMFHSVELKRWYLVLPSKAINEAKTFLKSLQQAARGMFFTIEDPKIKELPNDTQVAISNQLTECGNSNPQMIVCIVSTNSADRYATIKKRCFVDFGIPNQVIVHKTITPKDKNRGTSGLLSVATKVAIQMNCKLGGLPWMIDMPLTGLMTIGYDVCHDPKDKKASWGAVVATMDLKKKNCQFFSAVNRHTNTEEMSNFLSANIAKALQKFYEINGTLPARILFFRDGVGDGQIAYVYNQELVAIRNKMKDVYMNMGIPNEIKFAYMIVTKKVNTRFFFNQNNPKPGTCVDDVVTLPERFDFYLVPQAVNQGTVSPTSFNVIFDSMGLPPDRLQQLAFRFTFFYFNWTGTVRVPAMCQYAHKLAFLASQSMQTAPHTNLSQTLYYL